MKTADTPLPFYVCCRTCGERLSLGMDCDLTEKRMRELTDVAKAHPMTSEVFQQFAPLWQQPITTFTQMLCFMRLHAEHQLFVWTTEDMDQSAAKFADADLDDTSFFNIDPLPLPEIEATLRGQVAALTRNVQQLRYALTDLQMQGVSPREREDLLAALRAAYPDEGTPNVLPTTKL